MKVLLGTTNPSKVNRFKKLLENYDVEFLTLEDLNIDAEPEETGKNPEQNAIIKAKFYGKYFDCVICNDSGLYIDSLNIDDERQPGLKIRSPFGKRLDDEKMIEHYSKLVDSLGGKVLCYYLDGIAVYNKGKVYGFMETDELIKKSSFYMVSKPHELRSPGWPLDSISINKNTNKYFVECQGETDEDENENVLVGEYREKLINFLVGALGCK